MKTLSKDTFLSKRRRGFFLGLLAVLIFSGTLPAMTLAVATLDPVLVALGRSLLASLVAAPLLYCTRQAWPTRQQLSGLALVIIGIVIAFPLFIAWAMERVPASHGAVVLGLLPLGTALVGSLRAGERPSRAFWLAGAFGSTCVLLFAWGSGGGALSLADGSLLGAIVFGSLGYAEGGRLAREMGGWQVICWSVVLASPLLLVGVMFSFYWHGFEGSWSAYFGFAYLSFFSAFLGFFAWYHGMALGGIAKVSQLQLLQPFFTLFLAFLFLGERLSWLGALAMLGVVLSIFLGRRS